MPCTATSKPLNVSTPSLSPLVVYFHSVAPAPFDSWPLRFLTMDMGRFEDQLRLIAERKWRTVFLDEWWAVRNGRTPYRGDAVCITFDDGLLDNWVYAFPLVRRYGLRMTLFVCPELIEDGDHLRPTLEDVWAGRVREEDLQGLGHLSWGELRAMLASGVVDVQSHTMSHAKFAVSSRLRGFHYGGFEGFYPLQNMYDASEKPRYMHDPRWGTRLPMGAPLLEESSSVTACRHTMDPGYMERMLEVAARFDLADASQRPAFEAEARALHARMLEGGEAVARAEAFQDTVRRVEYEVRGSREVLEAKLGKEVRFLCWPHGDNSPGTHTLAKEAGYLATTAGKLGGEAVRLDRIGRVGTDWPVSLWWARRKFGFKFHGHHRHWPYAAVEQVNAVRHRLMGRT